MDNTITETLTLELTRREFLIKAGILLLAITGISAILRKTFLPGFPDKAVKATQGFGAGGYGN